MMELAAGIVWAFWNMVSPEKEEKEDQTVRIELIGQDLFKYEGDRIEKVGATDWDQCMAAIDNRSRMQTIRKLAKRKRKRK